MQNSYAEAITLMFSTTLLILLLAGFILTILFQYQKKQFLFQRDIEEIKLTHENDVLQTQLNIQERTLQSVSREIHDNIALSLTLSKLHLNTLAYPGPVPREEKMRLAISLISDAIKNLSNLSKSLNGEVISRLGLLKAVEHEVSSIRQTGVLEAACEVSGSPVFLQPHIELAIFRIIQESLNNVIKHAGARQVRVGLHYAGNHLSVSVEDDGKGLDNFETGQMLSQSLCCGLTNMKQRAKTAGGDCKLISTPGRGTQVVLTVPISHPTTINHG